VKKILVALLVGILASLGAISPAKAGPGCYNNWFCMHDTPTSNPFLPIDVYDTVLNQCVGGISPITGHITNNTNFRWIVSTSNDCAANRGIIYPHTAGNMASPWNNNIRGIFRTSSTSFDVSYPPALEPK